LKTGVAAMPLWVRIPPLPSIRHRINYFDVETAIPSIPAIKLEYASTVPSLPLILPSGEGDMEADMTFGEGVGKIVDVLASSALWAGIGTLVEVLADIGTIAASGIAIWLFITKQSELRALVRAVTNFVQQSSFAELRLKIESLGDLHAADNDDRGEIVEIFHDICGQIDGNPVLKSQLKDLSSRMRQAAATGRRPISEPHKRALVSELRESLRHLDVKDYTDAMRELDK
jgi:hypothetical protein